MAKNEDNNQKQAMYCKLLLDHPDALSSELEGAGDLMRRAHRYTLAIELHSKAHEKDPENRSAHIELLALQAENDYQKREKAIEKAQQLVLEQPSDIGFARVANVLLLHQ